MADIIELSSGRQFQSIKDLKTFCEMLVHANTLLQDEIKTVRDKISHLEELLDSTVKTQIIIKSPEQGLIENQIERLTQTGIKRELTTEEVKCLDILIKNKLLLNGEATAINGDSKQKKKLSPAELTIIAKRENK